MASLKTNKNTKRTPLLNINFSLLETLFFGPKRFLRSKGLKMEFVYAGIDNQNNVENLNCFDSQS